jgi:hypothetical protein
MGVINERELAAVVAHGLLNTVTVVAGSARTLRQQGHRLTEDDRQELLAAIVGNAQVFCDALDAILSHCSDAFGDAATTMALAARTIRCVPIDDLPPVLDGISEHAKVLEAGLSAMVRGLPADVVAFLDGLRRPSELGVDPSSN